MSKTDIRKCQNPEFEGEDIHILYCMNCDIVYYCDEKHDCGTFCVVINDKRELIE